MAKADRLLSVRIESVVSMRFKGSLDAFLGFFDAKNNRPIGDVCFPAQSLHVKGLHVLVKQGLVVRKRPAFSPAIHFGLRYRPQVIHQGVVLGLVGWQVCADLGVGVVLAVLVRKLVVLASVQVDDQAHDIELEVASVEGLHDLVGILFEQDKYGFLLQVPPQRIAACNGQTSLADFSAPM